MAFRKVCDRLALIEILSRLIVSNHGGHVDFILSLKPQDTKVTPKEPGGSQNTPTDIVVNETNDTQGGR